MSISSDNSTAHRSDTKLAHELANLIDGSLRNMGLALSNLRDEEAGYAVDDALMQRLEAANGGLEQMAIILRRWMREHRTIASLHQRHGNLAGAVEHAARLLRPVAAAHGVSLQINVDDDAADLPAGPLYPVIANALRNAIDSIASNTARSLTVPDRVSLQCTLHDEQLQLTITDTGPGVSDLLLDMRGDVRTGVTTKPDGYGIGLTVAADIAASLGGEWSLTSNPSRGATFTLTCLATNLQSAAG